MTVLDNKLSSLDSSLKAAHTLGLEEMAKKENLMEVKCVLTAVPGATGICGSISLPDLPTGDVWELGAAAENMIKAADAGSAASTVVALKNGATTLATLTLANTDANDTYIAGGTASTPALPVTVPGLAVVDLNMSAIATGLVAPITMLVRFRRRSQRDSLFVKA